MPYTEKIIKGKKPKLMLPEGYALVLEGGGMRGFYTTGILEAFMDEGIMFPYIIGVSAGIANAFSYISGQPRRTRQIIEKYIRNYRYVGYLNLFINKSFFGFDYIFNEVPNKHIFWDKKRFERNKVKLLIGTTDLETGLAHWFTKKDLKDTLVPAIASCSVPVISKIVEYNNQKLLDGGVASPIPIEKSIADGNKFHVIILTRNKGYLKKPFKYKRLLNLLYKDYPNFVETMLKRHEIYNQEIKICEQLEKEGKALIIRPKQKIKIGNIFKNIKKLLQLHDTAYEEGKEVVKQIIEEIK